MTNDRAYVPPVAFVVMHIAAVLLTLYVVFRTEVEPVWWFVAPVLPLLAPIVPLLQVTTPGRRKVYLISIGSAILVAVPIWAWLGFLYFLAHGKIG